MIPEAWSALYLSLEAGNLLILISILLHVNDHVKSVPIIPFGTTRRRISAVTIVITVSENRPNRRSFLVVGSCSFQTIMIGIDITMFSSQRTTQLLMFWSVRT